MSTIEYVRKLGYNNVQSYVNIGPRGTVDMNRLIPMINWMKSQGWVEIDAEDIEMFDIQPKDLIKYLTIDKEIDINSRTVDNYNTGESYEITYEEGGVKFRSGGWFIDIKDGDEGKYILYKPHKTSEPPISVQIEHIDKLYVLTKEGQRYVRNQKVVEYKRPTKVTDYPVYLVDDYGNKVVVYYALKENHREKFMMTEKYNRALNGRWRFKD